MLFVKFILIRLARFLWLFFEKWLEEFLKFDSLKVSVNLEVDFFNCSSGYFVRK